MPPVKSARTLYDTCLFFLNNHLLRVIRNIHRECGPYTDLKCRLQVENLQEYLSSQLHWYVIDNLLRTIELPNRFEDCKLMLLALFLHPQSRYMMPNFKLPSGDGFYIEHLSKLNKVIILDLTMVCTDEILKVVGSSCPFLEEIRIVSKVESVTSKNRRELNALKLKFFVSDDGLHYIHQCKNLKKIIMNQVLRSNCGGRKITHDGIRQLLLALPKLQYINFSDMGLVLESGFDDVKRLSLRKLHDNHIIPQHIDIYSQLCPDLKEICLKVPMTSDHLNMPNDCIERLTSSPLEPEALELAFFPFEKEMQDFLSIKGCHLTSFSIFYGSNITAEKLYYLGQNCPNLKSLEVKVLHPRPGEERIKKLKHNYFSNLEKLHLIGMNWDPSIILPLCVNNAKNLYILGLINREYDLCVDHIFEEILKTNPLANLQRACFHEGFMLTRPTLERFILSCQSLISFTVGAHLDIFHFLQDIKTRHNFDVHVQCDDTVTSSRFCYCYNRSRI